jgi:hypothetical protein
VSILRAARRRIAQEERNVRNIEGAVDPVAHLGSQARVDLVTRVFAKIGD